MDTPGFASPMHTYRKNLCKMRESNDQDGSETTKLCSLGVVDLDLSVSPDVFGLRAFDESLPITRMLPGSSPCELRLLLPDPLPHPALRGGVIPKLLSFVGRAMAIAQLTHLRISVPSSGAPPGEVPVDCFPNTDTSAVTIAPRRVTFAPVIPTPMEDTEVQWTDTDCPPADHCMTVTDAGNGPTTPAETQFQWPQADWILKGNPALDPGLKFVTSWSTRIIKERAAELPPLPLSPITAEGSQDSIMVQVGFPADETPTPPGLCQKNNLRAPAMGVPRKVTETDGNQDRKRIPRFLNERSSAFLRVLGTGCAFRHTTHSMEDHAPPPGGLGVPLNHPRFLEWVGAPASAWLLEMSPGQWSDTLSRDQAMTAAMQLHKDACLMNTNLDILDQYALSLHGAASKILQKTIGGSPYPSIGPDGGNGFMEALPRSSTAGNNVLSQCKQ